MKRPFVIPVFLLIMLAPPRFSGGAEPPLIQTVLDRTDAYCRRLARAAFHFTCLERVEQKTRNRGKQTFVYDYQLIKEQDSITEQRILQEHDGKPVTATAAAPDRRFSHEFFSFRAALAPIYFLGRDYRHRFRYVLTGKRRLLGRPAWEITVFRRAESPVPSPLRVERKGNRARLVADDRTPRVVVAWVDREDFSVLGFRVFPAGISGYNPVVEAAFRKGLSVEVKDIHRFGLLREGIRYPTKTEITLVYSPLNPGTSPATGVNSHVPGVSAALGAVAGNRRGPSSLKVFTRFTYTRHRFFTAKSGDPRFPGLE